MRRARALPNQREDLGRKPVDSLDVRRIEHRRDTQDTPRFGRTRLKSQLLGIDGARNHLGPEWWPARTLQRGAILSANDGHPIEALADRFFVRPKLTPLDLRGQTLGAPIRALGR